MVVLGLGSNLGKRGAYLRHAISCLTEGDSACISEPYLSAIYENPALVPEGAPESWRQPFYNMALRGETTLTAEQLLSSIQDIERQVGRQKRDVWAPREIDIDILIIDDQIIDTDSLSIPHKGLVKRDFFLAPLLDVAPDWRYPVRGTHQGHTIKEIAAAVDLSAMQRIDDPLESLA